jgi:hypothetical protein
MNHDDAGVRDQLGHEETLEVWHGKVLHQKLLKLA